MQLYIMPYIPVLIWNASIIDCTILKYHAVVIEKTI